MFSKYPDVVDVKQLCKMLNIGKNTAYALIHSEKLKYVKIGKVYKIPKKFIVKYLENSINMLYNIDEIEVKTAERSAK